MIEEEERDVAIYVFVIILALGLVILFVASCGCIAAKKNTRCLVISFAFASFFFMLFMLFTGIIVVEANRYVIEVIKDENGKANAGLLGLIPGFNNLDLTIDAEDRAKYKNVNRFMCGEYCPCSSEYEEMYKKDGKFAANYRFARFSSRTEVSVDAFYPDCYERLLNNAL